jgi:HEAT repeat protein
MSTACRLTPRIRVYCVGMLLASMVTILLAVPLRTTNAARKWTDVTGRFSTEADLLMVRKGSVVLRKPGEVIRVPPNKLCEADRKFAMQLNALLRALRRTHEVYRQQAADKLIKIGADAVPALFQARTDANIQARDPDQVKRILASIGAPAICEVVKAKDRFVQETLRRMKTATLATAISHDSPTVRREVALALGHHGDNSSSVEVLVDGTGDDDHTVRIASIGSLAHIYNSEQAQSENALVQLLRLATTFEHSEDRVLLIQTIARIPDARVIQPLIAGARDSERAVRDASVVALEEVQNSTRIFDEDVRVYLIELASKLKHPVDQVWLLRILSQVPDARVIEVIVSTIEGPPTVDVRSAAIQALGRIARSLTIPHLVAERAVKELERFAKSDDAKLKADAQRQLSDPLFLRGVDFLLKATDASDEMLGMALVNFDQLKESEVQKQVDRLLEVEASQQGFCSLVLLAGLYVAFLSDHVEEIDWRSSQAFVGGTLRKEESNWAPTRGFILISGGKGVSSIRELVKSETKLKPERVEGGTLYQKEGEEIAILISDTSWAAIDWMGLVQKATTRPKPRTPSPRVADAMRQMRTRVTATVLIAADPIILVQCVAGKTLELEASILCADERIAEVLEILPVGVAAELWFSWTDLRSLYKYTPAAKAAINAGLVKRTGNTVTYSWNLTAEQVVALLKPLSE